MKIVQTLWTKPGLEGGWLKKEYHFMSWALSCLQLRRLYEEVELYTDALGKTLLVDVFGLPYTNVHVVLDEFSLPGYLWAAPKIYTYGLQTGPFLHVDGDVFMFQRIDNEALNHDFLYQNREIESEANGFYTRIFKDLLAVSDQPGRLPEWITAAPLEKIEAVNAGVFGGTDVSFFQRFAKEAFSFFTGHAAAIGNLFNPSYANHIAEQVLPDFLSKKLNLRCRPLFGPNKYLNPSLIRNMREIEGVEELFSCPEEVQLGKDVIPYPYMVLNHYGISSQGRKYVHLIGASKKNLALCRMMATRLLVEYPEYHHRIRTHFIQGTRSFPAGKQNAFASNFSGPVGQTVARHAPPSSVQFRVPDVFKRTAALYNVLTGDLLQTDLPCESFVHHAGREIASVADPHYRERLQDVFAYEQDRCEFIETALLATRTAEQERMTARLADGFCGLSPEERANVRLEINPGVAIGNVKWDWSLDPSYQATHVEKSPFQVARMFDPISKGLVEIELTGLSALIAYVFFRPQTFEAGFAQLLDYVNVSDMERLCRQYAECAVYLITNGFLHVLTET